MHAHILLMDLAYTTFGSAARSFSNARPPRPAHEAVQPNSVINLQNPANARRMARILSWSKYDILIELRRSLASLLFPHYTIHYSSTTHLDITNATATLSAAGTDAASAHLDTTTGQLIIASVLFIPLGSKRLTIESQVSSDPQALPSGRGY